MILILISEKKHFQRWADKTIAAQNWCKNKQKSIMGCYFVHCIKFNPSIIYSPVLKL